MHPHRGYPGGQGLNPKYAIVVPDGAADDPLEQFGGKTVLQAAHIPNIDTVSSEGRQGLVRTIPPGMPPGSDVALMSVLGYDPVCCYTGRAPIEAIALGLPLAAEDWVLRCNLVTIADGKMADHSAGHISTAEAHQLIDQINAALANEHIRFYPGASYRHLLLLKGIEIAVQTKPPHDIIGQPIEDNLPRGKGAELLIELMAKSQRLCEHHEINRVRRDLGENPVSSIWLWGEGRKGQLESFQQRFGLTGAAITAVDLVRGLAKLIGFELLTVPGATGYVNTNYAGKGAAAIEALKKFDLVFVHIEAPDEAGHNGNAEMKKKALEQIDKHIVGPLLQQLRGYENWRILVMPDHPTPIATQAHSAEPVPFAMAGTGISGVRRQPFCEQNAAASGLVISNGHELMEYFLKS
jgi:2,3-bisphosphoglycerate-independent phosphoglycerate mutase